MTDTRTDLRRRELPTPIGVLTLVGSRSVGTYPIEIEVDPTGQFLYVVNRDVPASISQFEIQPLTGALTPRGTGQSK